MGGGIMSKERDNEFVFDFTLMGQAIKKAREAQGMTREELSSIVDRSVRHLSAIENDGQYPSFELLVRCMTMFDISLDQYVFPSKSGTVSTQRRTVDALLDKLDDRELAVIEATAKGLCDLKDKNKEK